MAGKTLRLAHLAVTVALVLGSVPAQAAPKPATAEALRVIDAWADAAQTYGRWPALSIAIGEGKEQVWSNGYGHVDAARKRPADGKTIYSICSISKLFTSVAVMQQWEAGKLRLDEPIATYLPWAKLQPDGRDSVPISLRALMTHSAGVPRDGRTSYWSGPDFPFPDQAELEADFASAKPLYPVGRYYQYSNIGLTLAGDAAAAVAGQPYNQMVESRVLTPLGLSDTKPYLPYDQLGKRMAVAWGPLDRDGQRKLLKTFDAKAITPAAGFSSTAEDLVKFGLWQIDLLKQDAAPAAPGVLRPSTLREMQRVQFTDPARDGSWGLGFVVERDGDKTYVGHDGSCPGYNTVVLVRPDSDTVVAAMTTDNRVIWNEGVEIHQLLDARRDHSFKGASPAKVQLEDYAGRYMDNVWSNEQVILPWNGGLVMLDLPSSNPSDSLRFLKPLGSDRFRVMARDGSEMHVITFKRDPAGKILNYEEHFTRTIRVSGPAAEERRKQG
jgi:CubicO group peptidase (beta-lactamase class C family)